MRKDKNREKPEGLRTGDLNNKGPKFYHLSRHASSTSKRQHLEHIRMAFLDLIRNQV